MKRSREDPRTPHYRLTVYYCERREARNGEKRINQKNGERKEASLKTEKMQMNQGSQKTIPGRRYGKVPEFWTAVVGVDILGADKKM